MLLLLPLMLLLPLLFFFFLDSLPLLLFFLFALADVVVVVVGCLLDYILYGMFVFIHKNSFGSNFSSAVSKFFNVFSLYSQLLNVEVHCDSCICGFVVFLFSVHSSLFCFWSHVVEVAFNLFLYVCETQWFQ